MNARDRDSMERIIAGQAEVKAEVKGLAMHIEVQNGRIARHFEDDLKWQQEYNEGLVASKAFRRGLLWPLGILFTAGSIVGPVVAKVMCG